AANRSPPRTRRARDRAQNARDARVRLAARKRARRSRAPRSSRSSRAARATTRRPRADRPARANSPRALAAGRSHALARRLDTLPNARALGARVERAEVLGRPLHRRERAARLGAIARCRGNLLLGAIDLRARRRDRRRLRRVLRAGVLRDRRWRRPRRRLRRRRLRRPAARRRREHRDTPHAFHFAPPSSARPITPSCTSTAWRRSVSACALASAAAPSWPASASSAARVCSTTPYTSSKCPRKYVESGA